MLRFTRLFIALDETTRTGEKVAALETYFHEAPAADAAWGLWLLMGNRLAGIARSGSLLESVAGLAGLPLWLAQESYTMVGDLAETLSLLAGCPGKGTDRPLHALIEQDLLPLRGADDASRIARIHALWRQLDADQCLVFNKMLTGAFRVGASRTLVLRALAAVAGVEPAAMAHRVMGGWQPTPAQFAAFLAPVTDATDPACPYPFYLASPLDGPPQALGMRDEWQAEWKWDGIRCQLIRRQGTVVLWSRGEELITGAFPELAAAAARVPDGTVLDGELLAWRGGHPLHFALLQRRLGRKHPPANVQQEAPVAFLAYDCLEWQGVDIRERPLDARRDALAAALSACTAGAAPDQPARQADLFGTGPDTAAPAPAAADPLIQASPILTEESWDALHTAWGSARTRGVEGLMFKRRSSPYRTGRVKGDWWKWKVDPLTLDAVVIYAQHGHGKRASLFSDYTFAVWDGDALVPIAKAYSGLSDDELRQVDAWVKRNTTSRRGPLHGVTPELVMELAFEGIQESTRHRSGLALRFPRIARWRRDKKPEEADTIGTVRKMLDK